MTRKEAHQLGNLLKRRLFPHANMQVSPAEPGRPAIVRVGGTFLGTIDRDVDDGEVSYALTVPILHEDLE